MSDQPTQEENDEPQKDETPSPPILNVPFHPSLAPLPEEPQKFDDLADPDDRPDYANEKSPELLENGEQEPDKEG